jgi:CheY-like chemotaxis protein
MRLMWVGGVGSGRPPSDSPGDRVDAAAGMRGQTILVVDDDPSILDTVSEILVQEGYHVAKAASGEEALAIVRRTRPSLILLDMRMPNMDGWAVARALRERDISIPIVVMTAAENAKRWADEIGAAGYLAKPFELEELLRSVEERT